MKFGSSAGMHCTDSGMIIEQYFQSFRSKVNALKLIMNNIIKTVYP